MKRLVFHIDVNSAFLSWEAARRVREGKDDLRLIPSCIGGNPEKRTSIVLAKSIPAKKYNIRTGEPISMALRKCPDLVIAEPDFSLYDKCSKAFIEICKSYTPVVEQFSIDECFLDMSGMERIYPEPIKTAYEIKDRIKSELGFTVNVGIGSNKLCAKMASDFEKPDKVHTLFENEIPDKMWTLPVSELISVGKNTAVKLEKSYVRTIGDLAKLSLQNIQSIVGNKFGEQLYYYSKGIDESPVLDVPPKAKGYSAETSFEDNITTREQAHKVLLSIADSVAFRIRDDGAKAYCVAVNIRTNDFKNKSHQRHLDIATDITTEIYSISKVLFDELWDGHSPLRLMGVSLTDITREHNEQMSLFSASDKNKDKERKIDKTVDNLRNRFGTAIISRGLNYENTARIDRKHKAQFENKRKSNNGSKQ